MVLAAAHLRVTVPALSDPQLAVPTMIRDWLPQGRQGIGLAVLFAAALTTLGGVWSAMAAMVAADFGWARGSSRRRAARVPGRLRGGELAWGDLPCRRHPQSIDSRQLTGRGPRVRAAGGLPLASRHDGGRVGEHRRWHRVGRGCVRRGWRARWIHLDVGDLWHPSDLRHRCRRLALVKAPAIGPANNARSPTITRSVRNRRPT